MIYTRARLVWKGFCGFYILFIIIIMNFFTKSLQNTYISIRSCESHKNVSCSDDNKFQNIFFDQTRYVL